MAPVWALLLMADVATANVRLHELAAPELYTAPLEVADALVSHADPAAPQRLFRPELRFTAPRDLSAEHLNLAHQYWMRQTLAAKAALERDLRYATGYTAAMSGEFMRFWSALSKLPDERVLDLLAVRYMLDSLARPRHRKRESDRELMRFPHLGLRVVERAEPNAMARVVYDVRHVATQDAAFDALAARDFDARRSAVVETSHAPLPRTSPPREAQAARYLLDGHDEVVIEADAAQDGLLVVAESYDPGWRASIDGREVAVLRANGMQQGVLLPSGRHEVRLRYHAWGFMPGAILSAMTLTLVLGIAWRSRSRTAAAAAVG